MAVAPGQTVTVQQVEAFENSPTNTHYAPVDFAGAATATDPTNYPGITFVAQANTTDTVSGHAMTVGTRFYGPGSVGQPFVSTVYSQSANNFINSLNAQGTLSAGQPLPTLNFAANGIRVSNHSYVADFGNATADENAIRRIDYVVNRDDVVMAAGAVTGNAFANQNLVWSARNVIAVRGDGSVFDPSPAAGNTITSGRRRADVWADESASFATGRVSSSAAALLGTAAANGQANAAHNQVVRSLIMTGADKQAVGAGGTAWTRDTANNLSVGAGAGKLDHAESLSILNAGEQALQPVSAGAVPNVATANAKGWSYGTVPAGGQRAVVVTAASGIHRLTATLNWNVTQTTSGGVLIDTSDAGRVFANLALELRPVTLSGGSYILGPATGRLGLSSDAAQDNVEHLYFVGDTGGGDLPAGSYALVISGDPSLATTVGFSYDIVPVPEANWLVAAAAVGLLALRRRPLG